MAGRPTDEDHALIDRVMDAITKRPAFDINYLDAAERHLVAVVSAQGIIDNGGFRYFFEREFDGDPDYSIFPEAFDAVGANEGAQAIRDALALFPNGQPHPDLDERNDFIATHFAPTYGVKRPIDLIEDRIMGHDENYKLVADYIRAHPVLSRLG